MNKDNIKKALKCCCDSGFGIDCGDCPYHNGSRCNDRLCKDTLDLITEQEKEIERLRQEVRDTDKMARNSIEQYKNDYDKALERLKAQQQEIDKLKDDYANLQEQFTQYQIASDKEIRAQIKQSKIEAVKEFAEKLKKKYGKSCSEYYPMLIEMTSYDIDELLKEYEE